MPDPRKSIVLDLRPLQNGYAARGIGRYTRELVSRFVSRNLPLKSLYLGDLPRPFPEIPTWLAEPASGRPWLWDQTKLAWELIRSRTTVFHSFVALGPLKEVSFPAAFARRSLLTVHDWHMFHEDADDLERFYRETLRIRIQRRSLFLARGIVCDTDAVARETRDRLGASCPQIRVVSPGCDHLKAVPAVPGPGGEYFLSVGDAGTKNPHFSLKLMRLLRQEYPTLKWHICGSRHRLHSLLGLGPEDEGWICVHENADDAVLKGLYQGARALLHPALREGFGIPPMEAQNLGCPVLASDIPPFRETLKGHAILPLGNMRQWLEASRSLLTNPARRTESIEQGRRNAAGYTWDKAADQLERIYEEMM